MDEDDQVELSRLPKTHQIEPEGGNALDRSWTRRLFNGCLLSAAAVSRFAIGQGLERDSSKPNQRLANVLTADRLENLVGINFPAGGGASLSYEGFPIFRNRVRESRGFTVLPGTERQVPLSPQGWPTTDFACVLYEGHTVQSWLGAGKKPFKCGFIGNGSERISGNGTAKVLNVVHGSSGRYTTFDLYVSEGGGFCVSGTSGGVTNVYAYLPDYPQTGIDDPLLATAFTHEAIKHYSQFHHIRWMEAQCGNQNTFLCQASNRRNSQNTQANQGNSGGISIYGIGSVVGVATGGDSRSLVDAEKKWEANEFTGRLMWNSRSRESARIVSNSATSLELDAMKSANLPGDRYAICLAKGESSAILLEPWTALSGTIILTFPDAAYDGIPCKVTNGSRNVSLLRPMPSTVTAPFFVGGIEGYPVEWAVSFCKACNVGLWICMPIYEDGPIGSNGTYSDEVLAYLAKEFPSDLPIYVELSNELWNSAAYTYRAWRCLASQSGLNPFQYVGMRYHDLAEVCRRHFQGAFGKSIFQVAAWQSGGNGLYAFDEVFSYMDSRYGVARADVQYIAIAPYIDPGYLAYETVTAYKRSSPVVLTIDDMRDANPLSVGSSVDLMDLSGARKLNGSTATVLAASGSAGHYNITLNVDGQKLGDFPEGGVICDSASAILRKISKAALDPNVQRSRLPENIAVLALHHGMKLCAYESGVEWNATPNTFRNPHTNPNVAGVAMGSQIESVLIAYYQWMFDAGFSFVTHFAGGVSTAEGGFGSDVLSNNYAEFVARGSPMLSALQKYMHGYKPTRNVISGRGSIIDGSNYADNTGGDLPTLGIAGAFKLGPHVTSNGYLPYLIHCMSPGTYEILTTTSNGSGAAYTDVEANGKVLCRAAKVTDGESRIAVVELVSGLNYILFGNGKVTAAQSSCAVHSLTFL